LRDYLRSKLTIPTVSGKASAAVLIACFAITVVLIAGPLRLPLWMEAEMILAGWWVLWAVALCYLLYTGQRVSDDHQLARPRNWLAAWGKDSSSGTSNVGWLDLAGCAPDLEGCGYVVGIIAAIAMLFVIAWVLFEVAIPVVAFVMYMVVRGMLAKVVNDRHQCKDNLAAAFVWGIIWATIYTAPLAFVVWCVHLIADRVNPV
jgi:hypothetical protein